MKWTLCTFASRSKKRSVKGLCAIMERRSRTRNWRRTEFDPARPAPAKPMRTPNYSNDTSDRHGKPRIEHGQKISLGNPCLIHGSRPLSQGQQHRIVISLKWDCGPG